MANQFSRIAELFKFAANPAGYFGSKAAEKTGETVKKIGASIVQAPQRAVTSIALEPAAGVLSLAKGKKVEPVFQPKGKLQETIFGKEPIKGAFTEVGEKQKQIAGKLGGGSIAQGASLALAPLVVGGLKSLDVSPFGGGKKKAAEEVASLAGKSSKAIFPKLKTIFPDIADDILKQTSSVISKSANADEAAKAVQSLGKVVTSGFTKTTQRVMPQVANKVAGQHIIRNTDDLAIKAKNLVKDNVDEAIKTVQTQSDDTAVAVAAELMKKYSDDAARFIQEGNMNQANILHDKIAEIATTITPKLTEAGRTAQAATILARTTPEGQVRFLAGEINRWNSKVPGARKIPDLTGEEVAHILKEMREIPGMDDIYQQGKRFRELQETILSRIPSPVVKKIVTVWKAGLLTGVKTSGLNLFANTSHLALEKAKDVPAAVADSMMSLLTGQRTKTATLGGLGSGVQEGVERGVNFLKTGYDPRNPLEKLDVHLVNFGKGKVAKLFKAYTNTVFRVIGAADQPFYYGALSSSLRDQALAAGKNNGLAGKALREFAEELVKSPTSEMITRASADAATAVFQNKTGIGQVGAALQKVPIAGEFIVPFAKTPSAVITQVVNYSPAGVFKEILDQWLVKGVFDQRRLAEAFGRTVVGTIPLYFGYKLFEKGLVALDRPKDEREQKLWDSEGRKPNSVFINGKWRSPIVLGPAGNLILVGGHIKKAMEESGSPTEAAARVMLGSAKSFLEQTFLSGVNPLMRALNDPEKYGETYLRQIISSFVPTLVGDVAKATDPLERRVESVPEAVMSKVPGLRQELEPQVDVLGRERRAIGNPLEILIDPSRPSQDVSTPLIDELRRLTNAGFRVSPTLVGDKKGYKGLTQEQNTALWKRSGEIVDAKIGALIALPEYSKLNDEAKAKLIEKMIDMSKLVAKVDAVINATSGLQGEELKKKLGELKESGLLTREVFTKYIELR